MAQIFLAAGVGTVYTLSDILLPFCDTARMGVHEGVALVVLWRLAWFVST